MVKHCVHANSYKCYAHQMEYVLGDVPEHPGEGGSEYVLDTVRPVLVLLVILKVIQKLHGSNIKKYIHVIVKYNPLVSKYYVVLSYIHVHVYFPLIIENVCFYLNSCVSYI